MRVIKILKERGIKGIILSFKKKILHIDYHKAHYLRLNIDINRTDELLKGFDLDVKELVYEDFLKGDSKVFNVNKMEVYKKRFLDSTYKAYGIFENGRLVYSTWVSFHRIGMTVETKPVYLAPNEGYLEDSYCDPIARGRGLHSQMNNFRIRKIWESGRNRVIVIVQDGNTPAFKVQYKSGFEDLGTFYHGYFFGIKFNTLRKNLFDNK